MEKSEKNLLFNLFKNKLFIMGMLSGLVLLLSLWTNDLVRTVLLDRFLNNPSDPSLRIYVYEVIDLVHIFIYLFLILTVTNLTRINPWIRYIPLVLLIFKITSINDIRNFQFHSLFNQSYLFILLSIFSIGLIILVSLKKKAFNSNINNIKQVTIFIAFCTMVFFPLVITNDTFLMRPQLLYEWLDQKVVIVYLIIMPLLFLVFTFVPILKNTLISRFYILSHLVILFTYLVVVFVISESQDSQQQELISFAYNCGLWVMLVLYIAYETFQSSQIKKSE